ncbi:hypothetical protein LSAT2_011541 [Lamellibrachia satsuma]|nr:hypothetical protein LSAT2_011541 [Lamellibrachia satsuma]
MEEDGADGDEKPEKGRKRTKVTKEKPLEKTPKSKGKLEKGPKGRPAKLKKSDTTTTPSEGVEVKIKKRVKRKLVEKATNEEEGSSDVSEKEAPSEVTEPGVKSEKTEAKPTTVIDNVLDRVVPSNDVVAAGVADDVAASPRAAQCASPNRLGSPTPEAPKLWDSVSVDINAVQESPSEKAPDLSPITGAGHPQKKDADLPAASAKPEGASTDATVSLALKAEASTAIFDNTPPSTPEHPSSVTAMAEHGEDSSSRDQSSNRTDEVYSTKSEYEANLEVAVLMAEAATGHGRDPAEVPTQVCESPIACDMSTMSNSSGGSSGNAPGSESEEPPSGSLQKDDDDSGEPTPKRRKRTHKRPVPAAPSGAVAEKTTHRLNVAPTVKPELSDSEDGADMRAEEASSQGSSSAEKAIAAVSVASPDNRRSSRPSKYNFVEALEEGKYLEGEKRIEFLVGKIQEIRKIYMQLKAEVACIDRRRKRHRRRERESIKASGDQQQTPSHMDIECS